VQIWDLDTFQCRGTINAQCGIIYSLAVSESGRLLAGTNQNLIFVWDLRTLEEISTLHGHFGAVYALCVSGDRFFSASYDTTIRVCVPSSLPSFSSLVDSQLTCFFFCLCVCSLGVWKLCDAWSRWANITAVWKLWCCGEGTYSAALLIILSKSGDNTGVLNIKMYNCENPCINKRSNSV
jgi:WD40 repeat protein